MTTDISCVWVKEDNLLLWKQRQSQKCQFYFTSGWLISQQYFCALSTVQLHQMEVNGQYQFRCFTPREKVCNSLHRIMQGSHSQSRCSIFFNIFLTLAPSRNCLLDSLVIPGTAWSLSTALSHISSQRIQMLPDSRINICGRREWDIPARTMEHNFSVWGNRTSALSHVKSQTSFFWLNFKFATHLLLKTTNRIDIN